MQELSGFLNRYLEELIGSPDGLMGRSTRAALMEFQRAENLAVTAALRPPDRRRRPRPWLA